MAELKEKLLEMEVAELEKEQNAELGIEAPQLSDDDARKENRQLKEALVQLKGEVYLTERRPVGPALGESKQCPRTPEEAEPRRASGEKG